jgi:RHS repeat-associated protein
VTNVYTGLGHLAASEWWLAMSWKLDEWTVNALEENNEARFSNYAAPAVNYVYTYNMSGQLESRELVAGDTVAATELFREYDSRGNMRFGYERQLDEDDREEVYGRSHRSMYGSDQKLRFYHQYGRQVPDVEEPDHADDLQQEFRYDALGRRVLVRNLHRPFCDPQERDCTHTIERYIWDGDQLLWELRAPGDTSDNLEVQYGSGDEYGLVAYVNGGGIDAPLGIARWNHGSGSFLLVPHMDWRGQWELGTDEDGERYPECGADPNCVRIGWPSTAVRSYMEKLGAEGEGDWVGSVLRDQRDPSGFLYRRNRYYDPMAGRFTQPDPIGLAGGINLYGFASGDPVNFADPFGLQACDWDEYGNVVCKTGEHRYTCIGATSIEQCESFLAIRYGEDFEREIPNWVEFVMHYYSGPGREVAHMALVGAKLRGASANAFYKMLLNDAFQYMLAGGHAYGWLEHVDWNQFDPSDPERAVQNFLMQGGNPDAPLFVVSRQPR